MHKIILSILIILLLSSNASSADNSSEGLFLREESVLSDKGLFSSELGVFFRRQTGSRAGDVVKRETIFLSAIFRYGINNRSEVSLSVPYQYIQDDISSQNVPVDRNISNGLGDFVANYKYQLWFDSEETPDLIFSFSVDGDNGATGNNGNPSLGSGHNEYSIAVLAATAFDPAIYFMQLGYRYVDPAMIDGIKSEPGDIMFYRFGSGFALSEKVVLSFQLVGELKEEGEYGQARISKEHQLSFQFANTIILNRNRFIEPIVSIGLTPEAPDVLFGLSFPL